MLTIRRILAATDFSSPSRHATDRAFRLCAELCAENGSDLHLLHVIQKSVMDQLRELFGEEADAYAKNIIGNADRALDALAADSSRNQSVAAHVHLMEGTIVRCIAEYAGMIGADMLVVGARGEGFMPGGLIGTTASRLASKTSLPILTVKQFPNEGYRRMLVAVDFSPVSRAALEFARALLPHADVVLAHVFDLPFEGKLHQAGVGDEIPRYRAIAEKAARQRLDAFADESGLDALRVVRYGDVFRQLLQIEQEYDCDLIVTGKLSSGIQEYILGSVAKHVLAESQCDVLVVPGEAG